MARVAIKHFKKLLNLQSLNIQGNILDIITLCITDEDNSLPTGLPDENEIKSAIFDMSPDSAAGPDDLNGKFYQTCWNIIKHDIINFVHHFFRGGNITKFFAHTCLVLILNVRIPVLSLI